ncbi:MAG: hypothetical protein ACOYZ6_19155 [Chloroflexota bacterium]
MKISRLFLTFGLFAVLLASACAPAVATSPAAVVDASATPISQPTAAEAATQPPVQPEATLAPTEAALPVATSRGPDLHATDPSTVSLASGGLQLVEFFRFT